MRRMEACTLHLAGAQIEPPQIGLAKVAIGEIHVGGVQPTQIEAAKIAAAQVASLTGLAAPIEFLAATFAQQQIEGIGRFTGFSV